MFKKLEEEAGTEDTKKEESGEVSLSKLFGMSEQEPELRTLTIIGDINEELSKDVMKQKKLFFQLRLLFRQTAVMQMICLLSMMLSDGSEKQLILKPSGLVRLCQPEPCF